MHTRKAKKSEVSKEIVFDGTPVYVTGTFFQASTSYSYSHEPEQNSFEVEKVVKLDEEFGDEDITSKLTYQDKNMIRELIMCHEDEWLA